MLNSRSIFNTAVVLCAGLGGAAAANEARINHISGFDNPDTQAISSYTIDQRVGSTNFIENATDFQYDESLARNIGSTALIQGSLATFRIKQDGDDNVVGIRAGGSNASVNGSLTIDVEGDGNFNRIRIGGVIRTEADRRFTNPQYSMSITGDDNVVLDVLRGGGAGTLSYTGVIEGSENRVEMYGGQNGNTLDYEYLVDGDRNQVLIDGGTTANTSRIVDVSVTGSDNTIAQTAANATDASFTGIYTGNNIASTITQDGAAGLSTNVNVTHLGTSQFTHSVTQSGSNQSVNSTVTAIDGGSYSVTQAAGSSGAVYVGVTTLAASGTGSVNQ